MKRCSLFCLVGFLFCLSVRALTPPVAAAVAPHSVPEPVALQRLGFPTVALLAGASHVETFRVGVAPAFGQSAPTEQIDDHAVNATGRTEDRIFAAKVTSVLLDAHLYNTPRDRCLFSPGIVFRFWKGQECVDCVLCFHCNDILILTHDAQGRTVHTVFTNFTPRRAPLLALVKQAFPADQEIQALPAK